MFVTRSDVRVIELVGLLTLLVLGMLIGMGCEWKGTEAEKPLSERVSSPRSVSGRGLDTGMGGPPIDVPKTNQSPEKPSEKVQEPSSLSTGTAGSQSASPGTTSTTASAPTTGRGNK